MEFNLATEELRQCLGFLSDIRFLLMAMVLMQFLTFFTLLFKK